MHQQGNKMIKTLKEAAFVVAGFFLIAGMAISMVIAMHP